MDKIIREIDQEIAEAEKQYQEEFNLDFGDNENNHDSTSKNVRKLEQKVNQLAKTVHGMFLQFDQLDSSKAETHL